MAKSTKNWCIQVSCHQQTGQMCRLHWTLMVWMCTGHPSFRYGQYGCKSMNYPQHKGTYMFTWATRSERVCVYVCVCVHAHARACTSVHEGFMCLKVLAFALFYVDTPSRTCYCVAYGMIRTSQRWRHSYIHLCRLWITYLCKVSMTLVCRGMVTTFWASRIMHVHVQCIWIYIYVCMFTLIHVHFRVLIPIKEHLYLMLPYFPLSFQELTSTLRMVRQKHMELFCYFVWTYQHKPNSSTWSSTMANSVVLYVKMRECLDLGPTCKGIGLALPTVLSEPTHL